MTRIARKPAPQVDPPSDRKIDPGSKIVPDAKIAPDAPGSSPGAAPDSLEAQRAVRRRQAAAAVSGQPTPQQRGVEAARTLDDVRIGIETRNMRVDSTNHEVAGLETRLAEQLMNLSPTLTTDDRQRYADQYRHEHAAVYGRATSAAQELASYARDTLPAVAQAATDLSSHPAEHFVQDLPMRVRNALDQSAIVLTTHVRQAPQGNPELQRALTELGQRFESQAAAAANGHGDPGDKNTPGKGHLRTDVWLAGETVERGTSFSRRLLHIGERAGGAFGAVGGVVSSVDPLQRVLEGRGRVEHGTGLAGTALEIGGSMLIIGGVSVGVPLTFAGAALVVGSEYVGTYRDRQEYVRDVSGTLRGTGVDSARAEGVARSNPESLRRLQAAGYAPEQIAEVAANAHGTLGMHVSQTEHLLSAAGVMGLKNEQVVELVRRLGPKQADVALMRLSGIIAGNPGVNRDFVLRALQTDPQAPAAVRALHQLLSAM